MPIFDFKCEKCDHVYEKMIRLTTDKPECPECGDVKHQDKRAGFNGFVRIENPDAPKNDMQLSKYLGNGQYLP